MDITQQLLLKIEAIKQQKVDFSTQKVVSYSQFTLHQNCPYQYKLLYIDKLKNEQDSNIHFTFGTAVHNTIQHYLNVLFNESAVKADDLDLKQLLKDQLFEVYKLNRAKSKENFTTPDELQEFFDDGVQILNYIKQKRRDYFNTKEEDLIGVEVPLFIYPQKPNKSLVWLCYLDIVLYNKTTKTLRILDIKTSTRGWNDAQKKDYSKIAQLILYKDYYSEQYGFPIDNIEVEYLILKRKLWENAQFIQKRIQTFKPAAGRNTINKVKKQVTHFLNDVFDENGKYLNKEYIKNTSNCKYCPFKDLPEKCSRKN